MNISWLKENVNLFRYERKFAVSELDRHAIESIVKCHPASFSEIFRERRVNNVYFDSLNMASYLDSQLGATQRLKVRIRWYGDSFGELKKPTLELKIKEGQLGGKILLPLVPFSLDTDFSFNSIRDVFKRSNIPGIVKETLMSMQIRLLICYSRKYFQSANREYRLTLDWDMQYYILDNACNTFKTQRRDSLNTVLELKYSRHNDDQAHNVMNYFPFRLSRNSKYTVGIDSLFY